MQEVEKGPVVDVVWAWVLEWVGFLVHVKSLKWDRSLLLMLSLYCFPEKACTMTSKEWKIFEKCQVFCFTCNNLFCRWHVLRESKQIKNTKY